MSRTRKTPYGKSKAVDRTCRNHGSCPWCEVSRTYNARKTDLFSKLDIKEAIDLADANFQKVENAFERETERDALGSAAWEESND